MTALRIAAGVVTLGLALAVGSFPAAPGAAQTAPSADPPDASDTPTPSPTPHFRLTVTPAPLHPHRTPSPKPTPTPTEAPTPTPTQTPTASASPTPRGRRERPTAAPTRTPKATPEPSATPEATATPEPTETPTPRATRRPRNASTPTPTPEPTETPAPATPEPTLRPTPHAYAPAQPTVPQSLSEPGVAASIARPIRELDRFSWMTGQWRAHNVLQLPNGKTRDLGLNTYIFALTMKDRWLFGADGKAKDEFYITYDPLADRYVLVRLEASPSYGIWVSPGWRGNAVVFTSTYSYANGRPYHRRITIVHKDAHTAGIYDEEQLPDGSWIADDAVELTKVQ